MLQNLRDQELRRLELKRKIMELEEKLPAMDKELFALYIEAHNEQADYENLKSFSLKNWFLGLTGKKEAMLDKERREAQAAKLKHDTAKRQLDWLKQELAESRAEMQGLLGCTAGYWDALEAADNRELLQEQRERTLEELSADLECCKKVLTDIRRVMSQVSFLHDQNHSGLNAANTMMASQMATMQKRIELVIRELGLFIEQVSNLGLRQQIVPIGIARIRADESNWAEVLSPLTRDTLLREAYLALEKAENELQSIQIELEHQMELLK